jgi:hypothetical protein
MRPDHPIPTFGSPVNASAIRPRNRAERNRLVDETIARYVEWRDECEALRASYRAWSLSVGGDRALRYAAYCSAVDREEAAARLYAAMTFRLTRILWGNDAPAL